MHREKSIFATIHNNHHTRVRLYVEDAKTFEYKLLPFANNCTLHLLCSRCESYVFQAAKFFNYIRCLCARTVRQKLKRENFYTIHNWATQTKFTRCHREWNYGLNLRFNVSRKK